MGSFNENKPPSYVLAADTISPDSLSFSGLVSIQEHPTKSPFVSLNHTKQHDQISNHSPEFEFMVTKAPPKSEAANSVKKPKPKPSNLINSIKQHQPQAISFPANETDQHAHHNSSLSSLLSAHQSNGQSVDSGNARKFNGVEKGRRPISKSFGGKFFRTLVSPCRTCHAFKPKAKVH